MKTQYDLIIVGGGLAGLLQGVVLAHAGWKIAILERSDGQAALADPRNLALSDSSRRILQSLGLWSALQDDSALITHIDVSQRGALGSTCLRASDEQLSALGYVVSAGRLARVFREYLQTCSHCDFVPKAEVLDVQGQAQERELSLSVAGRPQTVRSRLLLVADGARSRLREALGLKARVVDYGQSAVVATLQMDRSAKGWAFERFTASGPLALLPCASGERALIWAQTDRQASRLRSLSDTLMRQELQQALGTRAGRVMTVGPRHYYRLRFHRTEVRIADRCVLIGDAAFSFHPVAAQGFNLVIRDAAWLAQHLTGVPDPGAASLLEEYARNRAMEARRVAGFTDVLALGFTYRSAPVRHLRALGLMALEGFPKCRTRLVRFGMGVDLPQPDLALQSQPPVHG